MIFDGHVVDAFMQRLRRTILFQTSTPLGLSTGDTPPHLSQLFANMSTDSPSFPSHSSTWSILKALETLSPPPSWSSLDKLGSLCSSGDIPVLLHSGIKASLSAGSSSGSSLKSSGDEQEVKSVASSHSFDTIGTFGPVRFKIRRPTLARARPYPAGGADDSTPVPCQSSEPASPCSPGMPVTPQTPYKDAAHSFELAEEPSLSAIVDRLSIPDLHTLVDYRSDIDKCSQRGSPLRPNFQTIARSPTRVFTVPPPTTDDGGQVLFIGPSPSLSTLPTPVFAPPSPAHSLDTLGSSPNRAFKYRLRYAVNKGISYVAARNSPPPPQSSSSAHAPNSVPVSPAASDGSPKRRRFRRRTGSTSTTDSVVSSASTPPLPIVEVLPSAPSASSLDLIRFAYLPISLSWLKTTAVELLIDQEGFRSIQPAFHLVGYSGPLASEPSPMSLSQHLTSARADFMPTRRQSFIFHHATLDTPPVLRRLTLNGDASRDYTSRQAYLPLKSNGPYSVRGTDDALAWQLDYLVGDRRTDSGRVVPGEKTLTPLLFSCAPGLLHPAHAKKIRLVHVVKKGIVAKLTAERLEPPAPPRGYLLSRGLSPYTARRDEGVALGNSGKVATHRRVRSHALKRSPGEGNLGPDRGAIYSSSSYQGGFSRASDAGENLHDGGAGQAAPPDRHILSRTMIASLLSDSEPARRSRLAKFTSDGQPAVNVPLSPPRRH